MKIVKVSLNLSKSEVDIMKALAKRRGTTVTAVFRSAIASEKFFDDTIKDGGKVLVEDKRGRMTQVVYR